nr:MULTISPECIES: SDR family oxidoreductase [Streptomyces]
MPIRSADGRLAPKQSVRPRWRSCSQPLNAIPDAAVGHARRGTRPPRPAESTGAPHPRCHSPTWWPTPSTGPASPGRAPTGHRPGGPGSRPRAPGDGVAGWPAVAERDDGIAGRTVIVTGAGTGLGRAITEHLLARGANVAAVGRREAALRELTGGGDERVEVIATDITRPGAAEHVVAAATARFGTVHGLVNNAGLARFAPLETASDEDFDGLLATNVRAPAALIRAALPHLRKERGAVVNVSSVGGVLAMPGRSFYGASKAALNSLTRSLARELAPDVRVNAVLPGPVDTPMWDDMGLDAGESASLRSSLLAATPMGRFGRPVEVAGWVCGLLDPEFSGWITGALIPVDGGRTS